MNSAPLQIYTRDQFLMGSAFSLGVVAASEALAGEWLALGVQEIQRLEAMLTEFKPESETSRLNREAGKKPVKVAAECFALLQRSLAISRLSQGAFDITVKPLKKLYRFQREAFLFPSREEIDAALSKVGYDKIELAPEQGTVFFREPELQISFAAIGKGYASDRVRQLWQQAGVPGGYVNASGDLSAFGTKPDGSTWKVGIADPREQTAAPKELPDSQNESHSPRPTLFYAPLTQGAAATSGDYEQYFVFEGIRYSHNIDPRTGLPLSSLKSVTVFSPSAELSDALATAVYVKGVQEGIQFVDQLPQTHCILVDQQDEIIFSSNLRYESIAT